MIYQGTTSDIAGSNMGIVLYNSRQFQFAVGNFCSYSFTKRYVFYSFPILQLLQFARKYIHHIRSHLLQRITKVQKRLQTVIQIICHRKCCEFEGKSEVYTENQNCFVFHESNFSEVGNLRQFCLALTCYGCHYGTLVSWLFFSVTKQFPITFIISNYSLYK